MAGSKYYGQFGGQYVSESLMNTLAELEKAFDEAIIPLVTYYKALGDTGLINNVKLY